MDIQRFSRNLQKVLAVSREVTSSLEISYIGSEHIVYAMLVTECTAGKLLASLGVTEEVYRRFLVKAVNGSGQLINLMLDIKSVQRRYPVSLGGYLRHKPVSETCFSRAIGTDNDKAFTYDRYSVACSVSMRRKYYLHNLCVYVSDIT